MLNKVEAFIHRWDLLHSGDTVAVALSGGADSTALLYALFLLKDKLRITVEAYHYNHKLRGEESDRDETFVRNLCEMLDIPLHISGSYVVAGEKGLEAAAREARYRCFENYHGKVATAHTADDNAETILMHLIRGTSLKGLGGIAPVRGSIIRPMLSVTRFEVLEFLRENCLRHVEDSSNETDDFLRNRLRHHVMPLLKAENPSLSENLSTMALRLRQDEQALARMAQCEELPPVSQLRQLHPSIRSRMLESFLRENGVKEPEAEHIALAESLIFSEKPSARGCFPGGVTVYRDYDRLTAGPEAGELEPVILPEEGALELPELGLRVICCPAEKTENSASVFTVRPSGPVTLRSRHSGDEMRLSGGTKSLKKIFIDRKIPARQRLRIPVLEDRQGILGVCGIGVNMDRAAGELPAVQIRFENI